MISIRFLRPSRFLFLLFLRLWLLRSAPPCTRANGTVVASGTDSSAWRPDSSPSFPRIIPSARDINTGRQDAQSCYSTGPACTTSKGGALPPSLRDSRRNGTDRQRYNATVFARGWRSWVDVYESATTSFFSTTGSQSDAVPRA